MIAPPRPEASDAAWLELLAATDPSKNPEGLEEELHELLRASLTYCGLPGLQPEERQCRVLRPDDAAKYLGLSEKTLQWHRRRGSGPAYVRLGERNATGYIILDLDIWLHMRRVVPTKPARRRGRPPKGAGNIGTEVGASCGERK